MCFCNPMIKGPVCDKCPQEVKDEWKITSESFNFKEKDFEDNLKKELNSKDEDSKN